MMKLNIKLTAILFWLTVMAALLCMALGNAHASVTT